MTNTDRLKIFDEIPMFKLMDGNEINLSGLRVYLIEHGFFVKPAALSHHNAYTGGLFDHSLNVMRNLLALTDKLDLKWEREMSPYIIGMFHDLCKTDEYIDANASDVVMMGTGEPVSKNPQWVRNDNQILIGHGIKSVMLLSQFMTLTEEEIYCITYHMGAYETDRWNQFDLAIKKYPNVLWTHTADMYASKVIEE
jgi:hypothetical protein